MSITINYFFNYSGNLTDLAQEINQVLGSSLAPFEGDAQNLFCRFLAMEFSLYEHDLENDLQIDFENYRYCLDFKTAVADGDLRISQLPAIALVAHALFRRMKIVGMLVYDSQILLAVYEENSLNFYDTISKEFVSFPAHFYALQNRMP